MCRVRTVGIRAGAGSHPSRSRGFLRRQNRLRGTARSGRGRTPARSVPTKAVFRSRVHDAKNAAVHLRRRGRTPASSAAFVRGRRCSVRPPLGSRPDRRRQPCRSRCRSRTRSRKQARRSSACCRGRCPTRSGYRPQPRREAADPRHPDPNGRTREWRHRRPDSLGQATTGWRTARLQPWQGDRGRVPAAGRERCGVSALALWMPLGDGSVRQRVDPAPTAWLEERRRGSASACFRTHHEEFEIPIVCRRRGAPATATARLRRCPTLARSHATCRRSRWGSPAP